MSSQQTAFNKPNRRKRRSRLHPDFDDPSRQHDEITSVTPRSKRRRRSSSDAAGQFSPAKDEQRLQQVIQEDAEDVAHGIEPVVRASRRARPKGRRLNSQGDEDDQEGEEQIQHEDDIAPANFVEAGRSGDSPYSGEEGTQNVEEEEEEHDHEEMREHIRLTRKHGFASSGILLSVRLDRFMSHDCFQYDFGPNVNIIQGPNGSGKSAIVAALQIGLLGRVNDTERGKRLEDVIKHGCSDALISIRILNRKPPKVGDEYTEPDLTYKHEFYGDVITIERKLVRGQGGGFTVKARKRFVKLPQGVTPRQEICNIIDHFGFMVDNPVAILTQTKSKQFLAKGKPNDHYRLFRQATLLAPLETELKTTRDVTSQTSAMYSRVHSKLPETEENLRKKELAHQEAQEMKHIDSRINRAQLSFAWTGVQEEELRLQKNEATTANEFEPAAEKARVEYEKSQSQIEARKSDMARHQDAVLEATERSKGIATAVREAQKAHSTVRYELERQSRKLGEIDADADETRLKIVQAKRRMQRAREEHFSGQEQKSQLIEEIKGIDIQVGELKHRISTSRSGMDEILASKHILEDERVSLSKRTDAIQREFENKRRERLRVESAAKSKDSIARFGHGYTELQRAIGDNIRRFSRAPIGPVGQFISLDDESWALAVESAIGRNTLRAYIVHCSRDSSILQSIIPRGSIRPVIVIANLDKVRYDITPQHCPALPSGDCCTIRDALTISHDAVFNYLVDQSQIERVALDGTSDDVTRLGWSRIPNLHTTWNKRGDRAYTRNGSNTFRNGPQQLNAQLLTKDIRPYLESIKAEIQGMHADLHYMKISLSEKERALRQIKLDAQTENGNISGWQSKVTELETRKSRLEGKLNQAENAFDPSPYEQEISSLEESIAENDQRRSATAIKKEELAHEEVKTRDLLKDVQASMREANLKTKEESSNLSAVQAVIAQLKSKDRQLKREYDVASKNVSQAHQELDQQRGNIAAMMETARSFGECPDDVDPREKSSSDWHRELTTLKQRLETEQDRRGGRSAAEIEMDYLRAKKQFDENVKALGRVKFYVKALSRGVQNRETLLRSLDKSIRKSVRANFRKFLSTRGHNGTLKFKTENGQCELHIVTQMATHRKEDGQLYTTKDNRALSGGEKSYTTLCFILALAEICQNPLRVMDEIDVFQDEGTRHASFRTIVTFCTQYLANRQIIIITPHPLPRFDTTDAVRIQRLAAPRRGSSRGRQTQIDQFYEDDE